MALLQTCSELSSHRTFQLITHTVFHWLAIRFGAVKVLVSLWDPRCSGHLAHQRPRRSKLRNWCLPCPGPRDAPGTSLQGSALELALWQQARRAGLASAGCPSLLRCLVQQTIMALLISSQLKQVRNDLLH